MVPRTNEVNLVLLIEHFIEMNSGVYKKWPIWLNFSDVTTFQEFNKIIDELHRSGKIAIDKEGKIGWIWDPKLVKQYKDRTDLAFI